MLAWSFMCTELPCFSTWIHLGQGFPTFKQPGATRPAGYATKACTTWCHGLPGPHKSCPHTAPFTWQPLWSRAYPLPTVPCFTMCQGTPPHPKTVCCPSASYLLGTLGNRWHCGLCCTAHPGVGKGKPEAKGSWRLQFLLKSEQWGRRVEARWLQFDPLWATWPTGCQLDSPA